MSKIKQSFFTPVIVALGLHSAAIIAYQLVLMQLISNMQGYHFAYMIISIAMLGFGASGTFIALFRKRLISASQWLVPSLMSSSGMFMLVSFKLVRLPVFQLDIYLMFVETSQLYVLAASYLIYFLPFFLGALAIGILFIKYPGEIGRYYFSNLLGSGIGGILVVILLSNLFALHSLPLVASLSIAAAIIAFNKNKQRIQVFILLFSIATVTFSIFKPGSLPLSEYKGLSGTLNLPDAEIIYEEPDVHGKIQVVQSPALRYAPALSLTFSGEVPVKKHVFINAEPVGTIPQYDTTRRNIHDFTTEALPYILAPREKVLILKSGTGSAAAHALQNEAKKISAITEVEGIKELLISSFAKENNFMAHQPGIDIIYNDSRQFLLSSGNHNFDAIILPRLESFGGSTGINALQEDYALTLEAFQLMWDHLSANGVIAITTWIDYPSRTTLKIASTLVETLKNNGVTQTKDHLAAIKSWGTISFIISKKPLSTNEITNVRSFCRNMLFDPVLLPDISEKERNLFNQIEDESLFTYLDAIVKNDHQNILSDYDFHIEPATDDKPYFSRFMRFSNIPKLRDTFGAETMPFLELGYLIVWITLFQSSLLAFILIILPLFKLKKSRGSLTPTLLYFGALGLGYMFAEIIFIQRFILYFGHPVYAISAVISTMMIASGAGSLYSGKLKNPIKASGAGTIAVAFLLILYALFFTNILTSTIHLPQIVKIILAFIMLSVPAFFMGIPFPSGIRILNVSNEKHIPWAWGINGCLSVIATSFATLVAVENGFRTVMLFAAGFYLLAFFIFFGRKFFSQTGL